MKVIVTLFDYRSDYQILLWPNADRHLETILTAFADDPNILAWDLKNEPDKDYGQGEEMVNAWLRHVAQMARQYDPNHLLTIGWSLPEAAHALGGAVDFVSFHYYDYADQLPERYEAVATAVPDRPIVITEFGVPTWNSPFFPGGHTETEQAVYYADVLNFVEQAETAGTAAWTLYDFPHIPGGAVSSLPWRIGPEKNLGIVDVDGQPKMAAYLVAPDAFRQVTQPSALARFFKPFWLVTAVIALIFLAVIGPRLLRWAVLALLTRKPKR
jgi:endo-1,4-beta-mannosidase